MHPATRHVLQFFQFEHLPPALREISEPFSVMANTVAALLPDNPETTICLRKLLEAKDCAVRARICSHLELPRGLAAQGLSE